MGKDIRGLEVAIASPCAVRWSSMSGTDRARQCGLCQKSVYLLSGLTRGEVLALVGPCSGFVAREDGTVMASDCTVGARLTRRRRLLGEVVHTGVVGALSIAVGCLLGACIVGLMPGARRAGPVLREPTAAQRARELARIEARDAADPLTSKQHHAAANAELDAYFHRGDVTDGSERMSPTLVAELDAQRQVLDRKQPKPPTPAEVAQRRATAARYLRDHPSP